VRPSPDPKPHHPPRSQPHASTSCSREGAGNTQGRREREKEIHLGGRIAVVSGVEGGAGNFEVSQQVHFDFVFGEVVFRWPLHVVRFLHCEDWLWFVVSVLGGGRGVRVSEVLSMDPHLYRKCYVHIV
jgi:hypothetical protein